MKVNGNIFRLDGTLVIDLDDVSHIKATKSVFCLGLIKNDN